MAKWTPERIRNLREVKLKMSHVEFAAALGITVPTIYNWESGRTSPTSAHCKLIERTFYRQK